MPATHDLLAEAQRAGYQIVDAQQVRTNRWLLTLRDAGGAAIVVLVQARPLITAADVQDLAELVRLRNGARGLLWAYGGSLSPAAQRTLAELADNRLRPCTALPPAAQPEGGEAVQARPALRTTS
jgi:hypothetical protein